VPYIKSPRGEPTRDWTYYQNQIKQIYDLSDLVRRPVLLEMIVKTLPKMIAEGEVINRPNLYQRYLEGELDRQVIAKRRDLAIKREKRFEIMEHLALELYRLDRTSLSVNQIKEISKDFLTPEQQSELEAYQRDILTCSFLVRNSSEEYRFSHQSFMEYLVAQYLARDIMDNNPANLKLKPISSTIIDFLAEFEQNYGQRVYFTRNKLFSWLENSVRERWLGLNVVTILARLKPPFIFARSFPDPPINLSEVNLSGVNLSGVNLSGADLRGADLKEARLNSTILRAADLSTADLSGADLSGADLSGADLRSTHLVKANLARANFSNAKLQGSNLRGADLTGANLAKADLSKAGLVETKLSGANIVQAVATEAFLYRAELNGADLTQANLTQAKLVEAKLEGANLSQATLVGADVNNTVWGTIASKGTVWKSSQPLTVCNGLNLRYSEHLENSQLEKLKLGGALI
jgi:uncharacterized protein YjbI with pentapeptide repeats